MPFDSASATEAAVRSVKNRNTSLKLGRKALRLEEKKQWLQLLQNALASPVLSGVAAYFIVDIVEKAVVALSTPSSTTTQKTPQQQALSSFWGNFQKVFGTEMNVFFNQFGLGAIASGTTNSLFAGTLDYTALKAVILVYIASGGNLAGLLSSGGNIISNLLSAGAVTGA